MRDLISPATWWVAAVAAVVLILRMTYLDGYDQGFTTAKAVGDAVAADLRESSAREKQQAADAALGELRASQEKGQLLASQLVSTKADLRKTTDKLQGEIDRVTKLYRRNLDAQPEPMPACLFTAGFVRVWNEANSHPAVLPADAASRAADPARGTSTADQLASGVTQQDILQNHVRNGERSATCRVQLKKLIEWNTHGRS
ncbi:DNA-packaging protein [Pseudomonas asplenii]|uniref:DNA-packaging protein n=1 Tax=Pseudomonas asplenii TaxID=53407 RepID=UPI0037C953FD